MLAGLKAPTLVLMEDYCRGNQERTIQEAISALSAQMIASEPHLPSKPRPRESADANTKVSGYGDETCVKWTELHHAAGTPESIASDHWILGYIDALARYKNSQSQMKGFPDKEPKATPADMLKGIDKADTLALLEDYCRGYAQKTIQDAVTGLSVQLIANEPQVLQHRKVR